MHVARNLGRVDQGFPFAKGHGTENDFVLVPDPDGRLALDPGLVSALCDRRSGIGADGVIRVVRAGAVPEGGGLAAEADWYMDYRNADGSLAEMCGNGVRVFVAYLLHAGLASLGEGAHLNVATRAGLVTVHRDGDLLAADLGAWEVSGGAGAVTSGGDVSVWPAGEPGALPGLSVLVGNPHVVVTLADPALLAAVDLTVPPGLDPAPPRGANVEVVVPTGVREGAGHLAMRVHERGVGETRSCGSGAVAAALAARAWAGEHLAPRRWWVDLPGGRLRVTGPAGPVTAGPSVELAGPAALVAEGYLDPSWLADIAGRPDRGDRFVPSPVG